MVSEKFSKDFKNSKFLQRMYGSLIFLHPAISQFSIAHISFNIACKELKTAPIVLVEKRRQCQTTAKNVDTCSTLNKLLLERLFV